MSDENNYPTLFKKTFTAMFARLCAGSVYVIVAIIVLFSVTFLLNLSPRTTKESKTWKYLFIKDPYSQGITKKEARGLNNLVNRGVIISPNNILTTTISYYDSILMVLLGLIGSFALFTFFTIRSSSEDHAEKTVNAYLSSDAFTYKLEKLIAPLGASISEDLFKVATMQDKLDETFEEIMGKDVIPPKKVKKA